MQHYDTGELESLHASTTHASWKDRWAGLGSCWEGICFSMWREEFGNYCIETHLWLCIISHNLYYIILDMYYTQSFNPFSPLTPSSPQSNLSLLPSRNSTISKRSLKTLSQKASDKQFILLFCVIETVLPQ